MVPDAALTSLPLSLLVTEEPQRPVVEFKDFREVAWLVRRYATTVLPSVSSLRALRRFAGEPGVRAPFVGFGDPLLEGRAAAPGVAS